MRFVPLREFRNNSASVLRRLKQEGSLVVTSNGKPIALVRNLNEKNLAHEIAGVEREKFLAALGSLQSGPRTKKGALCDVEIQNEIRAVRRRRAA